MYILMMFLLRRRIVAEYEKTIAQMIGEYNVKHCLSVEPERWLQASGPSLLSVHVDFILTPATFRSPASATPFCCTCFCNRCKMLSCFFYFLCGYFDPYFRVSATHSSFALSYHVILIWSEPAAVWLATWFPLSLRSFFSTSGCVGEKIDFHALWISFLAHQHTVAQTKQSWCLLLTLGSATCLALPAWLNTVPSFFFLFCSHLCPSLFDNPDRHARWVTSRMCPSRVRFFGSHRSIRLSERGADVLASSISSSGICLYPFVASRLVCLRQRILPFMECLKYKFTCSKSRF